MKKPATASHAAPAKPISAASPESPRRPLDRTAALLPGRGAEREKINILIVDDTPENLLSYCTVLEELGENLVPASSGREALKHVLKEEFAVVLLDVNMPDMDGFETAVLIRNRRKSALTPIIFLTAFADEVRTAQGYAYGAVDYMPAPVVPEILRAKVRVFVELFRMRRQIARQAEEQLALAEQRVALAEERSKRLAAEESNRNLRFLAHASTVLGRSLDYGATARDLARLAVPFLGDLAAVVRAERPEAPWNVSLAQVSETGEVALDEHADPASLPEELRELIARVLDTGEADLLPPAGDHTPELAAHTLVRPLITSGRPLGVLALSRQSSGRTYNLTELAIAEALSSRASIALDNARLHQEIQRADRHKNEFLAMLAHELRNPLGPIRNSVEILHLSGADGELLQQASEMIERQVTHMARLVDDLLDATRIARGMVLLRKTRCDLGRVIQQTAEDYRGVFQASGLDLRVELPGTPVWVEGDTTRLAQVAGNLLHNAHKFTDPGGSVTLRLTTERGQAVFSVRDTGIGIVPSMLPRIFDVFTQADCSLERSRGGLGLGLALVHGLVQLHGGQVHARSEGAGRGAEFTVRIPLCGAASPELELVMPEPEGQRLKILVVEDNRDAAESTRLLLKLAGHEARAAYSGPEGLNIARTFQPDVILCDIGLPDGMSGYDFARHVRQDPELAASYIVALTGYGRDEDQRQAHEAGFDLHLTKPVDFDILRRALAGVSARARPAQAH